ncbi:class I SAM-dependent methyltransferase [Micromonospora sp. M12]
MQEYLSLESLTTRIQTHQRYSELADDVENAVQQAVSLSRDADLLDVGCGTGAFLRNLAEQGHRGRLVGLDTSPAAVHALDDVAGVSAQLGNAMDLPYDAAAFDVVTARHMLYHVPDVRRALAECRRVLRAEGVFAATVNRPRRHLGCPRSSPNWCRRRDRHPDCAQLASPRRQSARDDRGDLRRGRRAPVRQRFVFDRPEPVIAFAAANLSFYGIEPDSALRPELTRAIDAKVRAWFASEVGPWRDPKGYVICTARQAGRG